MVNQLSCDSKTFNNPVSMRSVHDTGSAGMVGDLSEFRRELPGTEMTCSPDGRLAIETDYRSEAGTDP
ncbi:hypothetical protein AB0M34_33255 [Nocardia sp. NPDC050193]